MSKHDRDDPYARSDYRRLIAWGPRIEREAPFLREQLSAAPRRRVVDLGCGSGEHTAHLHAEGWDAVGLDPSEDQIASAREHQREVDGRVEGPRFWVGGMEDLPALTDDRFGAAICLGNVLPSLDDELLPRALAALASSLEPDGVVVFQLLNYVRLIDGGVRHLPLNFRPDPERPEGEIVFLRLLRRDGDRHVRFYPVTLSLRPDTDEAVVLERAREVRLRAWRRDELAARLAATGFDRVRAYGGMRGETFAPDASHDLVLVARRATDAGPA